jgi:FkbM family methyltransferase
MGAGEYEPVPFNFALVPAHKPDQLLSNVRYALTLGLPEIKQCAAHDQILSIAGGGPSIADTYKDLTGFVAACNGSLSYLIEKGITPQMCGVCDPSEHMVDIVDAVPGVAYFIASCVHPKVFDKLIAAGCTVYLWHLHPIDGLDDLLKEHYPDGWVQIPGGCTMGTRWLTLGYHLGFRNIHVHGLDSSFRETSHAYPDHQDLKEWVTFEGFKTRIPFLGQVVDFIGLMDDGRKPDVEPIEIKMFGEGLLQKRYAHWLKNNPKLVWPATDRMGAYYILEEAKNIPLFLSKVPGRRTAIQAGGNVGVYPIALARQFKEVWTFEPETENYKCLEANTAHLSNIQKQRCALGATFGTVETHKNVEGEANTGAIHVSDGGSIVRITIDQLGVDECDLIWLDVEGYEELILKGAENTIDIFFPAIIIEENPKLTALHGLEPDGAAKWLEAKGYVRTYTIGRDSLFLHA